MLTHSSDTVVQPRRVVILGANGVIGQALTVYLTNRNVSVVTIGSRDLNLLDSSAADRLAALLRGDDAVVMLAAIPPRLGRDLATMVQNIQMAIVVCAALSKQPVAHAIYVSSDAVYPRTIEKVSEASPVAPSDPYAAMHLVREDLFRRLIRAPVAILRPTQVCAERDSHDAYGPNRFLRMAIQENRIVLFGRGEETRDHIMVSDVAAVIHGCLVHRSFGVLNVVTGRSLSFADVAELVAAQFLPAPRIEYAPRQVPITHRTFDASELVRVFPEMSRTPLEAGVKMMVKETATSGRS